MMAKRKLLDQVSDVARFRHLSLRTEEAYRNWIKRYIFYHGKRHPKELDAEHVRSFLTHLAVNEKVSASTQNQAFNALLFLYRQVLKTAPLNIEGVERARHSRRLPVVFTKAEATAVIAQGSSPRVSKGVVQVSRANALPNGRATAPIYAPTPLHRAPAARRLDRHVRSLTVPIGLIRPTCAATRRRSFCPCVAGGPAETKSIT